MFVEVSGQRHSRVGEREIGTKYTMVLTNSWSNQLWTALQAWYLYPQARAPDILAYYRCRRPTMNSVNTAIKRPYSTSADLQLYDGEVCMCLVEGEKIRSEGGCFRSVFVEVGGQRNSRVGEGERERYRHKIHDSINR
jgi:hypothetical protein